MRSQRLWTPRVWNTLLPLVQGRARRKLRSGLQPYRRTSVISQGYLTRWIAHLRTSMMRPRCWTCLTCRTENLKPSNVILSSTFGNSKCFASSRNKRSVRKSPDQANEEPMPVDGRMPVVAAIKGRRQFPWRGSICIAVQRVANVIWVLFVHAGKGEICKPMSRFDVELTCVLGGSTHREEQERGAEGQFHRLIL